MIANEFKKKFDVETENEKVETKTKLKIFIEE